MPIYTLKFKDTANAVAKTMDFEAQTAMATFRLLEAHPDAHHAELWTGGEMLAEITRGKLGLWRVDGKRPSAAERDRLLKKGPRL